MIDMMPKQAVWDACNAWEQTFDVWAETQPDYAGVVSGPDYVRAHRHEDDWRVGYATQIRENGRILKALRERYEEEVRYPFNPNR